MSVLGVEKYVFFLEQINFCV